MKVKKLIEELQKLDPTMDVIMQRDSEGNGYSPLADVYANCVYFPDSTSSGEVVDLLWTADEACRDEDEWERIKKKKRCVVLAPTN